MNGRTWKIGAGLLALGGAVAGWLLLIAGLLSRGDWPANIVEALRRTEDYIGRTQNADEVLRSGDPGKALGLYRQIEAAYSDLDRSDYVATALEDCLEKLGNKPPPSSMPSQILPTPRAAPGQLLGLQEIKVGYVHPWGKPESTAVP